MSDEFWVIVLIAVIAFAAGWLVQWLTGMRMLIVLLLLPLAGEAGGLTMEEMMAKQGPATKPPYTLNGWLPHCFEGGKEVTCTANPWTIRDIEWAYCLNAMEEAMRAMEPFSVLDIEPQWRQMNLKKLTIHEGGSATLPNEEEDYPKLTPYGLTQTFNAKAGRAIVLWDTAKRQCWRHP